VATFWMCSKCREVVGTVMAGNVCLPCLRMRGFGNDQGIAPKKITIVLPDARQVVIDTENLIRLADLQRNIAGGEPIELVLEPKTIINLTPSRRFRLPEGDTRNGG
jgi:hypothetical protein